MFRIMDERTEWGHVRALTLIERTAGAHPPSPPCGLGR